MPTSNTIIKRVQYHETDSMKVVHHSNYVKWMEEARLEFFRNGGFDWRLMEDTTGIMIPVLFQSVEHKSALRFDDEVEIECICDKFNGIKMQFSYIFRLHNDGRICAKGITKLGFIDAEFNPVMLSQAFPEGFKNINDFLER